MPAPKYLPHYTIADYRRWEGDWELWWGIPIAMTPSPFGRHQKLVTKLAQRLLNLLENTHCNDCEVVVELDWVIDDDLVVRPDVAVCCGQDIEEFIRSSPQLIIEVLSQSTESKDRSAKFELYQDQQVPYYLMVDSLTKTVEPFRLVDGNYQRLHGENDSPEAHSIELTNACQIKLSTKDL